MAILKTMRKNLEKLVPSVVKAHPGPLSVTNEAQTFSWVNAWAQRNYPHIWQKYLEENQEFRTSKPLNVAFPETMNEKMFWRKLFDFNPEFSIVSDKLAVKNWVVEKGINVEVPKVLWTGTSLDDLPEELIGQEVVLKSNHSWRTTQWLSQPGLTRADITEKAGDWLERRHHEEAHEVAYEGIPPRYFVEEGLGTRERQALELRVTTTKDRIGRIVAHQRQGEDRTAETFVIDANDKIVIGDIPPALTPHKLVIDLNDFRHLFEAPARQIGAHFDMIRSDFYIHNNKLYIGELTVYSMAGFLRITGGDVEYPDARLWDLRDSWFMKTPQTGWRGRYQQTLKRALDRASQTTQSGAKILTIEEYTAQNPGITVVDTFSTEEPREYRPTSRSG